jgi:glycosyltransferase involved in cell wall biosynthesis
LGDDVAVEIAGRGGDFAADRRPNVRYRGFVADAMEFLAGARAVAVPSVGGSGVQVKTLDAIASGNPVVSTAVGVRGLGTVPRSVRVEDDPAEFAAALREALRAESAPDDALEWARVRRERFAADVAEAVEAAAR